MRTGGSADRPNTIQLAEQALLATAKPTRVIATAGHVDHGKSTLVKALTGTDPDRWAEEKARGLTIDLGFAFTMLENGTELSFVDVPGHVRFLANMLAGVGGVAGCLFVVAATEGWKPQSEEHLRILELVGLSGGVVALTKVGDLDAEAIEMACLELADSLDRSFLATAEIVAVDAPSGVGVDELRGALQRMVGRLDPPAESGRPRLWVDRSFSAAGAGTVVTGTLTGGSLAVGDQLDVMPGIAGAATTGRVRGLQTHGRSVGSIGPGNRVAANLVGLARDGVGRGQALVRAEQWASTAVVDVSLSVLPSLDHNVSRRGAFQAYFGTRGCRVDLRLLGEADELAPGENGTARLRLAIASGLALTPGDRFVLRETGRDETVGGGEILDIAPVLPPAKASPDRSVDRVIDERGWVNADVLGRLTGERREPTVGPWVVSPAARAEAERTLAARLEASGELGLELAILSEQERALALMLPGLSVEGGRLLPTDRVDDDLGAGVWLGELAAQEFSPPTPDGRVPRPVIRELVRRGAVVESGGIFFATSAVENAAVMVSALLADQPEGATVSEIRQVLGTSRKFVLPLLAHLDATGVTRRRGDVRIRGPRPTCGGG